jgi:hypothetical protein
MTGRLPELRPADLDPAQRAVYDSMIANEVLCAQTGARAIAANGSLLGPFIPSLFSPAIGAGPYLTVCAIVNAFNVPVPAGTQPESSAP